MSQGFLICPRCERPFLPSIRPDSIAQATRCQNCGAVIWRAEQEAIENARLQAIENAKAKEPAK
jgi:hypothetical protein